MKNNRFIIYCCIGLFLFFSCSPKKGKVLQESEQPNTVVVDSLNQGEEEEGFFEAPYDEEEQMTEELEEPLPYLLASLRRTSCYGKCPTYHVKLFSDGRVTYHGKQNVARMGHFESRIEMDLIQQITSRALAYQVFHFSEQYPRSGEFLAELPSTITYFNLDGKEATITNNYDSPKALQDLEKELESFFDNLNWVEIKMGN